MTVVEIGVLIIVLLILQGIGFWYLFGRRQGQGDPGPSSDGMMLLQKQVQDLARTLDSRVTESSRQMQEEAHLRQAVAASAQLAASSQAASAGGPAAAATGQLSEAAMALLRG